MQKKFLEAGKIVGTHGVKGDLRVQSWCDSAETLCEFDTLYLDPDTSVAVARAQVHKNIVLMHLQGVDTMEAAEALKNRVLYLDRGDVELPEDLVFIQDILGFQVYDRRTGQMVGVLKDVLTSNPAHDMYEIRTESGRLAYLPAAKPFLKEIDMEAGVIYVETIEGLL
ncbi:ribosome maturation factor RimM [Agathobaculum sp.]|uniref:ribosome maturation factor RimM n=1 Tax=Agathobaculum sp. TaxID=2048138 RepID=UPI002A80F794|nr:ribosome maturation factor RimM [Agathobaculum sp.]MDY3618316.1 ribosome maturation factor RimM [Agathobaculum sp.]